MSNNFQRQSYTDFSATDGFTLIETLIAFLILSISIAISMQIMNTGFLKIKKSNEYSQILKLANRLKGLELYDKNTKFPKNGKTNQGISWRIEPIVIRQNVNLPSEVEVILFKAEIWRVPDRNNAYNFVYIPNRNN